MSRAVAVAVTLEPVTPTLTYWHLSGAASASGATPAPAGMVDYVAVALAHAFPHRGEREQVTTRVTRHPSGTMIVHMTCPDSSYASTEG